MKPKPRKCFIVVKKNKFNALDVYEGKDFTLDKDEKLFLAEIKPIREIKQSKS